MRTLIALALIFPLNGWVTVGSQVVPVGKDTYQVSMTGVGFATQATRNLKVLKAANDYCDEFGKHMVLKNSTESGVYRWSQHQDTLVFMCLGRWL